MKKCLSVSIFLLLVTACAPLPPPEHSDNACHIFNQYPGWQKATKKSEEAWGVPQSVQLAVMFQESSFKADSRPARRKILGIIPWSRPSSSYGYSQAQDASWAEYQSKAGRWFADRTDFADSADFIGWYGLQAHKKLGIPLNDSFHFYLAYHEGLGGYSKKSYQSKAWLLRTAEKVAARAQVYAAQLKRCLA